MKNKNPKLRVNAVIVMGLKPDDYSNPKTHDENMRAARLAVAELTDAVRDELLHGRPQFPARLRAALANVMGEA
jgi:hypothetical protein